MYDALRLASGPILSRPEHVPIDLPGQHFSDEEWSLLISGLGKSRQYQLNLARGWLSAKPLDWLIEHLDDLPLRSESRYVRLHAFYRRCRLPLSDTIRGYLDPQHYEDIGPQAWLDTKAVVAKHVAEAIRIKLYPAQGSNPDFQARLTTSCCYVMFKIWMAGYKFEDLTDELFNRIKSELPQQTYHAGFKDLWKILYHLKHPGISTPPPGSHQNALGPVNAELAMWTALSHEVPMVRDAYRYVQALAASVAGAYGYPHSVIRAGVEEPRVYGFRRTSAGSFRNQAGYIRRAVSNALEEGLETVDALVEDLEVTLDWIDTIGSESARGASRSALRLWLDFHFRVNSTGHVGTDVFPVTRSRVPEKRDPKHLYPETAAKLLTRLGDFSNPTVSANNVVEYYAVRALLLIVLTASRPHEVLLLDKNCLASQGETWGICLPKTKGRPEGCWKPAVQEVVDIVRSLARFSPDVDVHLPYSSWRKGDGRSVPRLFPSQDATSVISLNVLMTFFQEFQQRNNIRQPNGKLFTLHDLRRLCGMYLAIRGYSQSFIQKMLGHKSIQSQVWYKGGRPDITRDLQQAALKGIHRDMYGRLGLEAQPLEELLRGLPTGFGLQEVVWNSSHLGVQVSETEHSVTGARAPKPPESSGLPDGWTPLGEDANSQVMLEPELVQELAKLQPFNKAQSRFASVMKKVREGASAELLKMPDDTLPLIDEDNPFDHGFRTRLETCKAHFDSLCQHTEMDCPRCDWYRPLMDTVLEHAALVFCNMLVVLDVEGSNKRTRKGMLKTQIDYEVDVLRYKIDGSGRRPVDDLDGRTNTRQHTFVNWFGFSVEEADQLFTELWAEAARYQKVNPKRPLIRLVGEAAAYVSSTLVKWSHKWVV